MCGIVGFSGFHDFNPDKINLLLYWNSIERGEDSTGIFSKLNGTLKKADKASKFIIENTIQQDSILLGHVRSATSGAKTEKNAHPFEFNSLVAVHNGTISNIWQLLKGYDLNFSDFSVDSEALFAIIDKTRSTDVIGKVSGSMALLWYNFNEDFIYAYRNSDRPLYYGFTEEGMYISSIKESLQVIKCLNIEEFKEEVLYTIQDGVIMNSSVTIPRYKEPVKVPVVYAGNSTNDVSFQRERQLMERYSQRFGRFVRQEKWSTTTSIYDDNHYKNHTQLDFLGDNFVTFRYLGLEKGGNNDYQDTFFHKVHLFVNGIDKGIKYVYKTYITEDSFVNKKTKQKFPNGICTYALDSTDKKGKVVDSRNIGDLVDIYEYDDIIDQVTFAFAGETSKWTLIEECCFIPCFGETDYALFNKYYVNTNKNMVEEHKFVSPDIDTDEEYTGADEDIIIPYSVVESIKNTIFNHIDDFALSFWNSEDLQVFERKIDGLKLNIESSFNEFSLYKEEIEEEEIEEVEEIQDNAITD